jgi:hypothetical protein
MRSTSARFRNPRLETITSLVFGKDSASVGGASVVGLGSAEKPFGFRLLLRKVQFIPRRFTLDSSPGEPFPA